MQVTTEPVLGLGWSAFDPDGPKVRIAQLSKAELATLTKAAGILEALRQAWGGDDGHDLDTDVALAKYVMLELVKEYAGRIEI